MKFLILTAVLLGLSVAQRRDPRCPLNQDSRTTVRLAHPTDCNSFITCSSGNAFVLQCPAGQHWNTRLSTCDSPRNANCQSVAPQRPSPPRPPILPQWPGNSNNGIEHPDFLRCPERDIPGQVVHFPYHLNCNQFYQCSNGRAVL